MNNCNFLRTNRYLILIFLSFFCFKALSNNSAAKITNSFLVDPPSRPHMWVKKRDGINRRNYFFDGKSGSSNKSKFDALSDETEITSIICPIDNFEWLIDQLGTSNPYFMRIYFAAYDKSAGYPIPADKYDKHLTLIVCGVDNSNHDIGNYYNIDPEGKVTLIDIIAKEKWIDYYEKNQLKKLTTTISIEDSDNVNKDKSYSDTKSLRYLFEHVTEAIKLERQYQKQYQKIDINAIKLDLASYTNNGYKNIRNKIRYRNRLIIQFEYTHETRIDKYKVFYIDDQPGFRTRVIQRPPEINIIKRGAKLKILSGDTGLPCPPKTNCP